MATHVRLTSGDTLSIESPLADTAAALGAEGRLVALQSTFGGILHVNPHQVLYLEESPEVGEGSEDAEAAAPPQAPPPSQAPPA